MLNSKLHKHDHTVFEFQAIIRLRTLLYLITQVMEQKHQVDILSLVRTYRNNIFAFWIPSNILNRSKMTSNCDSRSPTAIIILDILLSIDEMIHCVPELKYYCHQEKISHHKTLMFPVHSSEPSCLVTLNVLLSNFNVSSNSLFDLQNPENHLLENLPSDIKSKERTQSSWPIK
ncbi:hypothetical protein AGLY_007008 [Aphis glycines]|uniref:Uncharacterized protein n=1 Tax=Aphis glycines TaxID=307491 RepID=A0A6G0TPV1_APHGL|nr:hypothetical protein AGLY_007008 [Aphis glycines]